MLNSGITIPNDSTFKITNTSKSINNCRIHSFHKLIKITIVNFKYPNMISIPKFHKTPIKFRTVTVGCNYYNNSAFNIILDNLIQIYVLTIKRANTHYFKNSYQLVDIT